MSLAATAAIGLWLLAGCRERAPAEQVVDDEAVAEEEVSKPRIEVGVSGCAGLALDADRELVCLTRKPKPLHLWLDGASGPEVELQFDGVAIETKRTIDPEGLMVSVELPGRQGRLELETRQGVWEVELRPVSERYEALREQVSVSWKAGDAAAALRGFEQAMLELSAAEAGLLGCAVAPVVMASGDYSRVEWLANQLSELPTISCAGKAALLVAYVQIYLRPDINAAEQSLRTAEAVRSSDFETRIEATYLRGVLEHRLGQIDESLFAFARAARFARLIGDNDQHASALVMQAVALARLGRFAEAEALASEAEKRASELADPSLALDIRSSVVWSVVLRREDDRSVPDPSAMLREMIDAYSARKDRRNLASRRLDLALTLVQNGDYAAATDELGVLEPGALEPDLLVWYELTAARIAVHHGRFVRAHEHLARAQVLAELNQHLELEWHVAVTRGELERARGREDAAIEWFRKASQLADALALAVTTDAGRSQYVTTHSRADIALVELLLDRGETEQAMCTALAARARHLRGLWVRLRPKLQPEDERRYRELLSQHQAGRQAIAAKLEQSWELSTAELEVLRDDLEAKGVRADQLLAEATAILEDVAPTWSCEQSLPERASDAVLTMVPNSDGRRWTAMLARRTSADVVVETATADLANSDQVEEAAGTMLDQLAVALQGSQRIRVIPVGAFAAVDVYDLLHVRGVSEVIVTYSLGLGSGTRRVENVQRYAAVVSGSNDLAAVAGELAAVRKELTDSGWTTSSTWNPSSDTQPYLLHYAGHGYGSAGGWQSAIELQKIGRVSASQIVAGQRSPDLVVLGACGAGQITLDSIDGGMNLAAAFLLAGAQLVIAPIRDVDDIAAFELAQELYRNAKVLDPDGLALALNRAQRGEVARVPVEKSFTSWRAWTP